MRTKRMHLGIFLPIALVLGSLASVAGLTSPAQAARPAAASVPSDFPGCAWWTRTTPETMNVAFPDTEAVYWTTPILPEYDAAGLPKYAYVVDGSQVGYPQARYFSLTAYGQSFNYYAQADNGQSSGLADFQINPDVPGSNPWQSPTGKVGSGWKVTFGARAGTNAIQQPTASQVDPNSSQPFIFLVMRVYVPKGTSAQTAYTSVKLPPIQKVEAITGKVVATADVCDATRLSKITSASRDAAQVLTTLNNLASADANYQEPCSTTQAGCPGNLQFFLPSPCATNKAFPNPNNAYLTALFSPQKGKVVAVKGLAPTSPSKVGTGTVQDTIGASPVVWTATGSTDYQVRYWSLSNSLYKVPYPMVVRGSGSSASYSGSADLDTPLTEGSYYAVASDTKPNLTKVRQAFVWLPTDLSAEGTVEALVVRNMLASTTFTHSVQQIQLAQAAAAQANPALNPTCAGDVVNGQKLTKAQSNPAPTGSMYNNPGAASSIMTTYYPLMVQCTTSSLEAGGWLGCQKDFLARNSCALWAQGSKQKEEACFLIVVAKKSGMFNGKPFVNGCLLTPGVTCRGADLNGANLRGADLRGVNLTQADLRGADLTGANLAGAFLTAAQLGKAVLTGVDLAKTVLTGADTGGAILPKPGSNPTPTRTALPSPTAVPSPTRTALPSPTEVPSPTRTALPSPTATALPSPTATALPSPTRSVTASPTATAVPSPTRSITASPTASR